jgi:Flp pilus assembly secretin CpaC
MHRDAQVLEISFPVARIEVDDETICKVLATESTNLLVLGIAKGTTILTVWPQSGSLDLPPQRYRVSVRDAWSEDAADMRNRNLLDEAQASLLELFPDSALTLRSHTNGSLSVLGKAQSNDQAKQIIQLVRKMFLVPVIDRIAVTTP